MKSINNLRILFIIVTSICISACSKNTLVGLWQIENVTVGSEEVTPVGRWVQFNSDRSQTSGNGWIRHSVGTWVYDQSSNALKITNENGVEDPADPFNVSIEGEEMTWKRVEEGQEVTINLNRTSDLPISPRDKLLGIWDVVEIKDGERDVTERYDPSGNRYLFLRWDNVFIDQKSDQARDAGIYKVHGHNPILELVYYGENCPRSEWIIDFKDGKLILKGTSKYDNEDEVRLYRRVNTFPE